MISLFKKQLGLFEVLSSGEDKAKILQGVCVSGVEPEDIHELAGGPFQVSGLEGNSPFCQVDTG